MMSGFLPTLRFLVLLLGIVLSIGASAAATIEKIAKGRWRQLTTSDFDIITDLDEKSPFVNEKSRWQTPSAFLFFCEKLVTRSASHSRNFSGT